MNLISNSCVASYITRDFLNQEFKNPFCWNIIDFESCYNLIKYWDDIDFNSFELIKDNDIYSIIIDKKVKVQYVHYKFSNECTKITIKNNEVFYNKIEEYIIEKYKKRIKNVKKEKPVFLFCNANSHFNNNRSFTLEEQKRLENLNSDYIIILSFDKMIKSNKIITINQSKKFIDNGIELSKFLFSKIEDLFCC